VNRHVPVALAAALLGCGGDDISFAPAAPLAHGSPRDATMSGWDQDDAGEEPTPADAVARDAARPICTRTGDGGIPDAGGADAGRAASCAPRVLASLDFDRAPAVIFGGTTPDALAIGHASKFLGPPADRNGGDGACYLATHPGRIYLADEDAWAELGPFDLRAAPGCAVTLHVWVWYELEDGHDAANLVAIAGDAGLMNIGEADGPSLYNFDDFLSPTCEGASCIVYGQSVWSSFAEGATTWREATFDLSSFAGAPDVRLRLQFHSDDEIGYQGIYVGDIALTVP
jgi:hypothetical protein